MFSMTRRTRIAMAGVGWALVAAAVAFWFGTRGSRTNGENQDLRMPIGAFELIDQDSQRFGSEELRGKVSIVGFAFTSCTTICPMLTSQMANLQRRLAPLGDRVHFITITVDPEVDTPERLREFALHHNADLSRWSFLTGAPQTVRTTLERVFFVPVGERREVENGYDILHTGQLMLVDPHLRMRGLYPTDAPNLEQLERDVQRVIAE
jgi:protein SCO1/2